MKTKSELYFKVFVRYCEILEICVIGAFFVSIFAPFFDGNYQKPFLIYSTLNFLVITVIILLYIRDPNIRNLLSKDKASKVAKKQIYAVIFFIITIPFAYYLGWVFIHFIPMPIPGFYGNIFLLGFILWIMIYHKEFIQLFDVFAIYLKDQLYPTTWPAIARQNDREWRKENLYKSWLIHYGSSQEQSHYNDLQSQSPEQARKFAVSRMDQIDIERGKRKNVE